MQSIKIKYLNLTIFLVFEPASFASYSISIVYPCKFNLLIVLLIEIVGAAVGIPLLSMGAEKVMKRSDRLCLVEMVDPSVVSPKFYSKVQLYGC